MVTNISDISSDSRGEFGDTVHVSVHKHMYKQKTAFEADVPHDSWKGIDTAGRCIFLCAYVEGTTVLPLSILSKYINTLYRRRELHFTFKFRRVGCDIEGAGGVQGGVLI